MGRIRLDITFLAAGVCVMLTPAALEAQTAADADVPRAESATTVTPERIDQFQKAVAADTELSESDKPQIAELMQQALADLQAAEQSESQASRFEKQAGENDTNLADEEHRLVQPVEPVEIASGRSIADLESERVEIQTRITELEQDLKLPSADPAARTTRRRAARGLTAELPASLSDIEQKLQAPAPDGEAPRLTEARKLALAAQRRAVSAQLIAAQKELILFDVADAVNLPTLRREAMTREINAAQKRLDALDAEINRQRQAEAEGRAQEAQQAAIHAQPLLKSILEESQEIIRSEQELRSRHEDVKQLLRQAEDRTREIQDDAREAERLDIEVGLGKMGVWLRKQRDRLQDLAALSEQFADQTEHLEEAEFAHYERNEQLEGLADVEARADELTAQAAADGNTDLDAFHNSAIQVLRSQSINLQKLVEEYSSYTDTLVALDKQHQLLTKAAGRYAEFLDERILWVRSHPPVTISLLREDRETLSRILNPQTWRRAGQSIARDAADHPWLFVSMAVLLAYVLGRRNRHRKQLHEVARQASGRVTTSMAPTIHCLRLTIRLALAWPGLMLFLAWRLHESSMSSNDPAQQIAAVNLMQLAGVALLLEFVRQSIRPEGLADAHFSWNSKTLPRVRRLLWSVMIFGLPLAAVVACLHQSDPDSRRDGLERLFFAGAMLVLTLFAHGLLHPSRGALRPSRAKQGGGWLDRLGSVWYLLGVSTPIVLAGLALLGYYDTALKLAGKVHHTLWVVVLGTYLHALTVRWLMLRHRRLRIEQARERIAAAQSQQDSSPESGAPLPEAAADEADLESSNQQSRRLVSTSILVLALAGLWLLWADVFPAIRFLDRWPLWETTKQVVRLVEDPSTGEATNRTEYEIQAVTIASLIQVLFIIVLTTTATRNLPGLLEISILQRLPIDRSTAYAVTSLTRYGLALIGLILAGQVLGIGWSKVQWLAAALTFGLGFGLQEIFANFVSGIIILFEQPVRVGDIVTIDGVTGVVNRIRIRATTIVDWDRKEYIVPNREFITGRLLNWTLSDKMNRVVIHVGVAYGSDTNLVRATIKQVLDEHEHVLADPAPLVTFESFGDSALDFVVRAYLPNLDHRLETVHQLHSRLHDRLAAAGIEIPFPQRDLHLRTGVVIDNPSRHASPTNGQADSTETPTADHAS